VNEPFAPPGQQWQSVSPALGRLRRTVLVALTSLALVAVVAVCLVLSAPTWLGALCVVLVLAVATSGWVLVGRNVRWWGYAERDEDLYIRHGALFRTLVVVPYGRMQYVDVQAGPLDQAFQVASVHLHTASPGTSARIPGLPAAEAARLRDRLTALGQSQAAGL
jgi:membrane protein YdbS with pleckstrin-like domain